MVTVVKLDLKVKVEGIKRRNRHIKKTHHKTIYRFEPYLGYEKAVHAFELTLRLLALDNSNILNTAYEM